MTAGSGPDPILPHSSPTNLIATATSTSQISVTWNAVTTALVYQLFRKSGGSAFALVTTTTAPAFSDPGLNPDTAYVYQVRAVDGASGVSAPSNPDVATTIVFIDDPLLAGSTVIKAVHLTELRTAVNAVHVAAGLGPVTFTDPSPAGVLIKAVHVQEVRSGTK